MEGMPKGLLILGVVGLIVVACLGEALLSSMPGVPRTPTPERRDVAQAMGTVRAPATATMTPEPTPIPEPTAEPTETPVPSLGESIGQVARAQFRDKLRRFDVRDSDYGPWATIDYDLGTRWDERAAIDAVSRDLITLAPRAFALDELGVLELHGFTTFSDVRGNSSQQMAMGYSIGRRTAQTINWANMAPQNLGRVLLEPPDSFQPHPALFRAWGEYRGR